MNDEQMQSVLDEWFEDTDPQPPNAQRTTTHVMAQVPQTRQRGRWLPFRLFRPKAQTPIATNDTTDYQPTPIPATNGHSPTVLGRTQSMFSPVKAITAGALVFAIGGVFLIAQPFDQQGASVPGAATEVAPPVEFTATWGFSGGNVREATADGLDPTRYRDGVDNLRIIEPASDPSFVGDVTVAYNYDEYRSTGARQVTSRAFSVENDVGTWRGVPHFSLNILSGGKTGATQVFIGERGYEGLYAVAELTTTPRQGVDVHGFIFEGEPPPAAEPFVSE
jgi:hypothetical protein